MLMKSDIDPQASRFDGSRSSILITAGPQPESLKNGDPRRRRGHGHVREMHVVVVVSTQVCTRYRVESAEVVIEAG